MENFDPEAIILAWCRSKPHGFGHPVMREARDGKCKVLDANSGSRPPLFEGKTWEDVYGAMIRAKVF